MSRLSGFVIHKNGQSIERCVAALRSCCDDVVVVDTGSERSFLERVRATGARVIEVPWQGFGQARRTAVEACEGEYCLFLDADETLEQPSLDLLRTSELTRDGYRVWVNDWAVTLTGRRFLFRRHARCRVFRRAAARYDDRMLVHESPGIRATPMLPVVVEHDYATAGANDSRSRVFRNRLYSVLWAVQHARARKRPAALVKVACSRAWCWVGPCFAAASPPSSSPGGKPSTTLRSTAGWAVRN